MAIINAYKAIYHIDNSFENNTVFINATSMNKALEMLNLEYGKDPFSITRIQDNVLTEITDETTVSIEVKSYYIEEDSLTGEETEIEVPDCIVYPTPLVNVKRGNTIYFEAPIYNFEEDSQMVEYTLNKFIYNNVDYTDNPFMFTVPLDESITNITIKAIFDRFVITELEDSIARE